MSSLFSASQPAQSLFTNLSDKTGQQTANAFAKPPGSSLFPNLGTNQNIQQSNNSLFDNVSLSSSSAAQQQQQLAPSNPFGNTMTSSVPEQQAPASRGLFGNLGGTQAQQQPPQPTSSQGNLFGGLGSEGGQQNNGLGVSSVFNSIPNQLSQSGQQAQSAIVPSAPTALFQNLLERGKKRTAESNPSLSFGELPSLQLGLTDIASKVRNLGGAQGFSNSGHGIDSKAHYLLAASGVPRASTLRDLSDFPSQNEILSRTSAPIQLDTDIDAYVNHLQAKSNADLFREYMEQTKRDFDAFVEERYHMNLDEQRQRVYQHFGLTKPGDRLAESRSDFSSSARAAVEKNAQRNGGADPTSRQVSLGTSSMSKSLLGSMGGRSSLRQTSFSDVPYRPETSKSAQGEPFVRTKQEKYSASVRQLNSVRLQGALYPVIHEFVKVESEIGNDAPQHLVDAYRVLLEITKEDGNTRNTTDPNAIRERQYAKSYLDVSNSINRLTLRKQILNGSRKHLEDSFLKNVEVVVSNNPHEAQIGGVPSRISKIKAYGRIRASRKDLGPSNDSLQRIGNDYCWVLIFYLLRGGLIQDAVQYVTENDRAIKSMDRQFGQYLSAYAGDPDRRLPRYLQQRIEGEYSARTNEDSIDPYRLACLKIIGRCNLDSKYLMGVNTSMEDWMWVVLSLAREIPRTEENAGESFNLDDAQELVDQIGQQHFSDRDNNSAGYATFFLLQVLVGMFEKAVAWLHPYNYVAAAHFAIALDYYGLLRTAAYDPSETRLLTFTSTELPQLTFARLLGYYTRDFRAAKPEAATDYLVLIALGSDQPVGASQTQISTCHEALKELVLETREFAALLGDLLPDGKRVKGAIEQRLQLIKPADEDEFMRTLILQAATVADDSGRTTDAVLLYHLAGEYDGVIVLINRALSEDISIELGRGKMRLQPLKPRRMTENSKDEQSSSSNSLSLTSVDDPATLAKNMTSLYNADASYYKKIRRTNREACGLLIRMSDVKSKIENGGWTEALAMIESLQLLPLNAKGDVSVVRSAAQAFNSFPQVVARTIGNVLLWTIMCLGRRREEVNNSAFQTQRPVSDDLLLNAKDMMVFAGLIRYKLPPDVFEILARAGQDIGAF